MKRSGLIILVILGLGFLVSFLDMDKDFQKTINKYVDFSVDTLSAPTAQPLLSSRNVHWLDTRSMTEYNVSKIQDAFFVNYEDPNLEALKSWRQSDTIVVYCTVGYRSEKTALMVEAMGFENVYNLYGGILDWANHNLPLKTPLETPTKKVHTYDKSWGKYMVNPDYEKVW